MDFQRVLVLSPHTDDAELGAGGTIARFVEERKQVFYVGFSICEISVPEGLPRDILKIECRNATRSLGIPPENVTLLSYPVRSFSEYRQKILDDLLQFRKTIKPDLVLAPSSQDMHQDHGVIYHEALRAFKKEASIWGYEHPWNNLSFTAGIFVRLTAEQMDKKVRALSEYKSQGVRGYMSPRNIYAQVYTHGVRLGIEQAEAFELARLIY